MAQQAIQPPEPPEYNSLQRSRQQPLSCEDTPAGPTQRHLPPPLRSRGQHVERSRRSLPKYYSLLPTDRLEDHPTPAPREYSPTRSPDTESHEDILKESFSMKKKSNQRGFFRVFRVAISKTEAVMSLNAFNFDEFENRTREHTLIKSSQSRNKESFLPSREFADAQRAMQSSEHRLARPPETQKEKPIPPPSVKPLTASQAILPEAFHEYNSLRRPRQPPSPPSSCEDTPEGPTQPLAPPLLPSRRQHAERSRRSLPEYFPLPPIDKLEDLEAPAPHEHSPTEPPDTESQEAIRNKNISRRKERKHPGVVDNLTIDLAVAPEPYFKDDSVISLHIVNFDDFIQNHDKTIVMFLNSSKKESFLPSREFANASMRSSNKNHVFAAVDYYTDEELCCIENANQLPMIKFYSNGFTVGNLNILEGLTAVHINILVTIMPVLKKHR